ncbi:TetR family transcriptional regulator [Burkholderia pseudomallei]|uniref:TetR-family regulatory protein n=10 Tax=Pseudomonadota TaxID=1224 RepID=Q63UM7_BURPS|nr:transcriptional regulator, TetR family [Burkholderia mallei ATCC 23344]ALJ70335.1 HTH-type transcriptional regulator TtgR [Burkholderia pseudomallei]EDK85812.1 transcriptional regulator, TetR family [Burkholderia mallei 2002721280]EDO92346.1 transcriptional regulator, TetR family [Burkholderia pseudomallei Pasteur 52237]EDU07200.1 transcriptional regulator, TetR family [Burkholderia pseudomallei 1655]EEP87330.1 transcriptional regulator, TetR family [Burkholderia mallei GB8 horse 4]EES2420
MLDFPAMKPIRLTREQSKDLTRERLLSAAHAIFTKKGYVAASVEDIASAAGYTRGAFYSNFRSKAELLIELLKRDHEEAEADLQKIFESGGTREQMEAHALEYYSQFFRNNPAFLLWGEAKLQATRDAKFRARFNEFVKEKRDRFTHYILTFAERVGTPLLLPADVLALGLMSLCDGVQSYHAADPRHVTGDAAQQVLAGFFARVVLARAPD